MGNMYCWNRIDLLQLYMRLYVFVWIYFWNVGRKVSFKFFMDIWRVNRGKFIFIGINLIINII